MVVEITGSTIVALTAVAVATIAAGAMIQAAQNYDTNAVTNVNVNVWDRYPLVDDLVWVDVSATYPGGGYLEFAGDINLCLVPDDEATNTCTLSGESPKPRCDDAGRNNTIHGCWSEEPAGSSQRVNYKGVLGVDLDGAPVQRDTPLGFVVRGLLHSSSGVVLVR